MRQVSGFGFRIIGGREKGSQATVGGIVSGGAADGRLQVRSSCNYPCAVCGRVMHLCSSVYVRTYMCVCRQKNTPVCVLLLETLH